MERGELDSTGRWRWSYCKCPQCNRTHEDWAQVQLLRPAEMRGERQIRQMCDPCLAAQVGKLAFARYKRHWEMIK